MQAFVLKCAAKEHVLFDSGVFRALAGAAGAGMGFCHLALGRRERGLSVLSAVHRASLWHPADRAIERAFRGALGPERPPGGASQRLREAVRAYPGTIGRDTHTSRYFDDPSRLLEGNTIVLKASRPNEPGVLNLRYSYTYPLFLRLFDVEAVAREYYIVLEPSWSGFCDPAILGFATLSSPVFVGAIEPRDAAFVDGLGANLISAPFSSNSWVDGRLFRPVPGVAKDIDVIVIAAWASYKRHWAVFRALGRLRARGIHPRVALVGYALEIPQEAIRAQARHYGVEDLLEIYERVSPEDVNVLLNRSKVNLLWSRREGVNRAIVEGMFAGVPCIVREGFNYGYRYPYINESTGRYATEASLPDVLAEMIAGHASFAPDAWVQARMGPQATAAALNDVIRGEALKRGQPWTRDIVPKVNTLDGPLYWNPDDATEFAADYRRLRTFIR